LYTQLGRGFVEVLEAIESEVRDETDVKKLMEIRWERMFGER
jgi:hypothetical protein